jgi:hypothetical protein
VKEDGGCPAGARRGTHKLEGIRSIVYYETHYFVQKNVLRKAQTGERKE